MLRIIFITLCITSALSSCAAPIRNYNPEPLPPGKLYTGTYIDITSPNSERWNLVSSSNAGMEFARKGSGESESFVALVQIFDLPQTNSPEEFEAYVVKGASRDAETQRFTTSHFSHSYTNERGYPCVRTHNISQDKKAQAGGNTTATLRLENIHLYCEHPTLSNTGFVISYSHRGYNQHSNFASEASSFLEGVQVPEQPAESN